MEKFGSWLICGDLFGQSNVETDFMKKARWIFGGMKWVYGIPTSLQITSRNSELTFWKFYFVRSYVETDFMKKARWIFGGDEMGIRHTYFSANN